MTEKANNNDLTVSYIDRQNILNNPYALSEIEKAAGIKGIPFQGKTVLLKEQVAAFFEVTTRTIDNYIEKHNEELSKNGYAVIRGKSLREFKLEISGYYVDETDFANITMAPQIGIFGFRAFLNMAMLLTESHRAKTLRSIMLDIVVDTIIKKSGGRTTYINQRDEIFLEALFSEDNYRKEFTNALGEYVDWNKAKYPIYTDKIYVSIFKEKTQEYRAILRLQKNDATRDTFYSEILELIASYECGFADWLKTAFHEKGRKLTREEVDTLFSEFEKQAHWKPLIERARNKMASRDLAFRDALHEKLKNDITPLQQDDFERFLGEKSQELEKRLEEAKDVLERLKAGE